MFDTRPVLAFIDPGRRKVAFLSELSRVLSDRFRCVFYSRRFFCRGILRQGRASLHPGPWSFGAPPDRVEFDPEVLRSVVGAKAKAKLGKRALVTAPRYLAELERFFDEQSVQAIFVWNGATLVTSMGVHLARQRGLPVIFAEHGYLPGTMQLDVAGVNFDSSLTPSIADGSALLPATPSVDDRLDELIAGYRNGKPLRELCAPEPQHLRYDAITYVPRELVLWMKRRIRAWTPRIGVQDRHPLPKQFILMPFQVTSDVQVIQHSPLVGNDMSRFLRTVHEALRFIRPGMKIVCKLHPRENLFVQHRYAALVEEFPDVHFIFKAPMNDLINRASAVVTINSTVGFEALLLDKPVVALGRNFYTFPGLVEVVSDLACLPQHLETALTVEPSREKRRAFLRFVISEFLTFGSYDDCSERSLHAVRDRVIGLLGPPATPMVPRASASSCTTFTRFPT